MPLRRVTLNDLTITDEPAFAALPIYPRLKQVLQTAQYPFLLPTSDTHLSWDRALFLNLTFWQGQQGADVLMDEYISADMVAHVAWHHLANTALQTATGIKEPTALSLFMGESIASAFDLYLLGKLLRTAPGCDFITTQVPIISEAADEAGVPERGFTNLLEGVAGDPDRAFEDMRALLMDITQALLPVASAEQAQEIIEDHSGHRFAPLLHHYQISNWLLYARAYNQPAPALQLEVERVDACLREAPSSLQWLHDNWLGP